MVRILPAEVSRELTEFLSLLRRSKEENLIIKGTEGFKNCQQLIMAQRTKYVLEKTCILNDGQLKQQLIFSVYSENPTYDDIVEEIKALLASLGEGLETEDINFRYMEQSTRDDEPTGEWIHVHGPRILPGYEWMNEDELAAARAVRETHVKRKYVLEKTWLIDDDGQLKLQLIFSVYSENPTYDDIVKEIKALLASLGEGLETEDTNFRYMEQSTGDDEPTGEWIHVHGPLILPGYEWMNEDELAAARAVREIHAEKMDMFPI